MVGNQSRFTGSPTLRVPALIRLSLISRRLIRAPVDTSVTTHDEMAVTKRREIAVATLLINQSYTRTAERGVIGKPREGLR